MSHNHTAPSSLYKGVIQESFTNCEGVDKLIKHLGWIPSSTIPQEERWLNFNAFYYSYVYEIVNVCCLPKGILTISESSLELQNYIGITIQYWKADRMFSQVPLIQACCQICGRWRESF